MKYILSAAFATLIGAASAHAATVSVMDGDHNVIDQGGSGPNLAEYGHTASLFTDSASGHAAAIAAGNIIIVEERAADAAAAADYAAFISGGGRVILLGSFYATTETLFNGIFGSSTDFIGEGGSPCCGSGSYEITGEAAGTTFDGGPASLGSPSSVHPVASGLPGGAEVFYENSGGSAAVFRMTLGAGDLFYMNWDYCCGSATEERAYYDVLDSAITFEGASAAVPLPAAGWMLIAGLGGIAAVRRRRRTA